MCLRSESNVFTPLIGNELRMTLAKYFNLSGCADLSSARRTRSGAGTWLNRLRVGKKCIQLNTITCKMHIEIIVNHTKGVFLLDNLMKEVLILTKPLILSSIFFSFCRGTGGDNLSDVTDQPTGTMQNDVWQVFIVRHVLFHP